MELFKLQIAGRGFFQPLRVKRFVFLIMLVLRVLFRIVRDSYILFRQIESEEMIIVMGIAALKIRYPLDHVVQMVESRVRGHDHPAPDHRIEIQQFDSDDVCFHNETHYVNSFHT